MRLLGKYDFEHLRNCLQGVFEFYATGDFYVLELWQLRFTILPKSYVEISINQGQNKPYKSLGKFFLSE